MRTTTRTRIAAAAITAAAAILPRLVFAQSLRPFGNLSLPQLMGRVIGGVLGLLGTLAVVMFVYGGFTWMTAQGNMDRVKKAKSTIIYAILGLMISVFSYVIVNELLFQILAPQVILPEGGSTVQ